MKFDCIERCDGAEKIGENIAIEQSDATGTRGGHRNANGGIAEVDAGDGKRIRKSRNFGSRPDQCVDRTADLSGEIGREELRSDGFSVE